MIFVIIHMHIMYTIYPVPIQEMLFH